MSHLATSLIRAGPRNSLYRRAILTPFPLTASRASLSNYAPLRNKEPSSPQPQKEQKTQQANPGNPELPKFSLEGLGLSKNMRIVVLVIISIFGTLETWVYCKAIWRWWKGGEAKSEPSATS